MADVSSVMGVRRTKEAGSAEAALFEEQTVWHMDEGFFYRVVTLCLTRDGTVLALVDGRLAPPDGSPSHLLLKRSTDLGRTWSESVRVAEADGQNHMNPLAIQDRRSGVISLFYAKKLSFQETNVYLRRSVDDGLTWSRPERVDTMLKDRDFQVTLDLLRGCTPAGLDGEAENAHLYGRGFLVPTPGNAIQLSDDHPVAPGRLVVPVFLIKDRDGSLPTEHRGYGDAVLSSDDGGATWRAGGTVPIGAYASNECVILEKAGGTLAINARTALGDRTRRTVSESTDGGMTWSTPRLDHGIPRHTHIQAGMCRVPKGVQSGDSVVLYSFPDSLERRERMTVAVSTDEGATWPRRTVVHAGPAKYSNLLALPDGTVLLIYGKGERGEERAGRAGSSAEAEVAAVRFNLPWLTR